MRVLLDVDGVVCDFSSGYCALVREVTGKSFTPADVTEWDFKSFGLTAEQRLLVERLLMKPGWVASLGDVDAEGASAAVSSFADRGCEVVFVTSPWPGHPTWSYEREEWIRRRFPGAPVVSTKHKHLVVGDVLVDDRMENVSEWLRHHRGLGMLWDAPYNRESRLSRVRSWHDVFALLVDLPDEQHDPDAKCGRPEAALGELPTGDLNAIRAYAESIDRKIARGFTDDARLTARDIVRIIDELSAAGPFKVRRAPR